MRTLLSSLVLALALVDCQSLVAQEAGKPWMRYPAISPDGSQIAFSYQGDLWVVPVEGGSARLLTTHEGYERSPVWSPDGNTIAFASDRHGNFDVFTIPSSGGRSTRLTHHSAADTPYSFTPDGQSILFSSRRADAPDAVIGSLAMGELYSISVSGGRPQQVMTSEAEYASTQPGGSLIAFHDYKGYEDRWRKHHVSSVTRDVWTYDPNSGEYKQISPFEGEDRNPVWAPDGQSLYYLSEMGGTMNVYHVTVEDGAEAQAVTSHQTHPVRFLSIAANGTLAYGYNGEIWVKPADGEPRQVDVQVAIDERSNPVRSSIERDGATEMAVSPNEDEIAFVIRGEVFVTSIDYGSTKRITATPEQERSLTWGPDGRTLYYASERGGSWNIYKSSITREDDKDFSRSTLLTEEPVLVTEDETFQPVVSPNGKRLAYLRNRDEIMMLDLETKQSSSLVPAARNYSYSDGDIQYTWSPDSRWLAVTYSGTNRWIGEIGLVNIASGEITNVSESGYTESAPRFSRSGDALLYVSDRFGRRSHGSWGSDDDVFALYLTQEAFDLASMNKEQLELHKERQKKEEADDEEDDSNGDDGDDGDDEEKEDEPLEVDLTDLDERLKRLTIHSALVSSYELSPDGETLIYLAQVEDDFDLWVCQVRDRSTYKALATGSSSGGQVRFAKDGKSAFLLQGGRISKLDMSAALKAGGRATPKPVSFAAEMTIDGPAERAHLFEHAWRQAKEKFYDPQLHGVDWQAMKENYAQFLPTINNNHDFAELLSELLGELNASHTGGRYRPRNANGDQTASFGLLYDVDHEGVGLKVAEVVARGPVDSADTKIAPGTVITHIDGVRLAPEVNPYPLLNKKSGKPVRLGLHSEETGDEWEEVIRPISSGAFSNLLYERWIAGCRDRCEELSGGRVGYVHVRGMNDSSFRRVFSEVLGINSEKEALIVDTRFNGGGWLHDDLVTFLSGKDYVYFVPRGKQQGDLGAEPTFKWSRPVAVVQSESNYSDAHFFPWAFKELGVGPLVGAPVPGTATAVWWETLIDPELVFGIPQVGMVDKDGNYLENQQLEPDVLVINDPQSMAAGEDKQLAKAVELMLEQLDDTASEN